MEEKGENVVEGKGRDVKKEENGETMNGKKEIKDEWNGKSIEGAARRARRKILRKQVLTMDLLIQKLKKAPI